MNRMTDQEQNREISAEGTGHVVVVGSLNEDLVVTTARLPGPGETIIASGHGVGLGGKGANQAVAARRMGAGVEFLGSLGNDAVAGKFLECFHAEGIGTGMLEQRTGRATGLAVIIVESTGENRILVSAGANADTTINPQGAEARELAQADVVLAQLEIPVKTVADAFTIAKGIRILNAAPAMELPSHLLASTDILVVNEGELATLAGATRMATNLSEVEEQAAQVVAVPTIIVTRGAAGSVIVRFDEPSIVIAAPTVSAIDTTGAGDCFCGTLAAQIARGRELVDAVTLASAAASLSATRAGAIASLPYRSELQED